MEALEEVFQGKEPNFFLLNSSLSSVLGGLGLTTHASANCLLDAFAKSRDGRGGASWISIGWDTWEPEDEGASEDPRWELAIQPEKGAEATARVLTMDPPSSVVISTSDLQNRLEQWVSRAAIPDSSSAEEGRPDSGAVCIEAADDVERTIIEIWTSLLGFAEISTHDDFFELGGNSLMAGRVVSRIRDSLGVSLPIQSIFEATTISDLAERVRTIMWISESKKEDHFPAGDREELVF